MRRRLLAALCAASLLSGPAGAAPARGAWGLDLSHMDTSQRPGDDFFRYVNGRWYDTYQFKPDETYAGARPGLSASHRVRIRELIEASARTTPAPGGAAAAVGSLYAAYLDTDRIEQLGLEPMQADLSAIRAISTREQLTEAFGRAGVEGWASPFETSIFYDLKAPGWMRLTLAPGGLGMGSREAYLDDSDGGRKVRVAYLAYVGTVLKLAGETDPAGKAGAILELETRLAKPQWPSSQAYDLLKTANDRTPAELKAGAPGFDWDRFLTAAGANGLDVLIVRQPPAMAPLVAVINDTPIETWKAWLVFHLISDHAEFLPAAVREASFAFYGKVQSGQEAAEPRWEAGVNLVQEYLGQAVGRLYVERYFSPAAKAQATEIFDNIKRAMRARLERASWMSPPTRAEALKKIDTLVVKIGYPDPWPDFSGARMDRADLWGDIKRLRARAWAERLAAIRAPLDRSKWQMSAQSSGAAANPNLNEITVPAGALEPPYFDPEADPAINYGGIGGVLGHELSHMFDNLGRQMDATGALRDWWAPEDAKRYEAVADKVVAQYGDYDAVPGHKIDGKRTLGENIADISGLTLAVDAYHLSLKGRPAPRLGGYAGDQRIFLGWAQMRMGKMRPEYLVQVMRSDPHAPDYFRVNGVVRNIDAWYAAFGVKPGDKLYLPPEQRARFW